MKTNNKDKKYKLTALTRVGRTDKAMQKGEELTGTWNDIYNRLNACFLNGCILEQQEKTTHYKVNAGGGSHVADIKLEVL